MTKRGRPSAKYPPVVIRIVVSPQDLQAILALSPTQRGEALLQAIDAPKAYNGTKDTTP